MSESVKTPKYGEYGTVEQQRALIQTTAEAPTKTDPPHHRHPRRGDRIITIALIMYIVVSNFIALSDHPGQRILERLSFALSENGYRSFDINKVDYVALNYWLSFGVLAIIIAIIIASYFRVKQAKSSFWIPLLGLVSIFIYQICVVLIFVN